MFGIQESRKSMSVRNAIALTGIGIVKEFPLAKGLVALVDEEDYEWLAQWKWNAHRNRHVVYASRTVWINGKAISVQMHRVILGLVAGDEKIVDHINRSTLDNRKENLRIVNRSLNAYNRNLIANNTSGYRGVSWRANGEKFVASVQINGTRKWCGCFNSAVAAANAYDKAAMKYWGDNAILNFPERIGEYNVR